MGRARCHEEDSKAEYGDGVYGDDGVCTTIVPCSDIGEDKSNHPCNRIDRHNLELDLKSRELRVDSAEQRRSEECESLNTETRQCEAESTSECLRNGRVPISLSGRALLTEKVRSTFAFLKARRSRRPLVASIRTLTPAFCRVMRSSAATV